ncbi:hypothetical protein [Haladaptatus sp. DYF46]|nr:hypothetical protein [Haladaptatus sp. DYF46]
MVFESSVYRPSRPKTTDVRGFDTLVLILVLVAAIAGLHPASRRF